MVAGAWRLFLSSMINSRLCQMDMVLGGYQIPSGTKVVTAGMVISNDEDHFDRPDEFIPERWMRGNPLHNTADPFAFLPFGRGPRCS